jgi:hypothetical protein
MILRKMSPYCNWDLWSFGLLGLLFWEGGLHDSTLGLQPAIEDLLFARIRINASASLHKNSTYYNAHILSRKQRSRVPVKGPLCCPLGALHIHGAPPTTRK